MNTRSSTRNFGERKEPQRNFQLPSRTHPKNYLTNTHTENLTSSFCPFLP